MNAADRAALAGDIAAPMIAREEACCLHAYPDPRSPMARAMTPSERRAAGDRGVIPDRVAALPGDPWTIGYGQTGPGIKRGLVWTRAQALNALTSSIATTQAEVRRMYPGIERLDARAEAALISLVYNRGPSLANTDRRREMRELGPAIAAGDYRRMSDLILSMRRLWEGDPAARGLLTRRENEAAMVRQAIKRGNA